MVEMERARFEELVTQALDSLPEAVGEMMDNCVVLVEDDPPGDDPGLLGFYDGIPLTERDSTYSFAAPDRITIYRNPTLAMCRSDQEVVEEVRVTVVHEVGHHFGIDDERLHELGWA